MDINKAYKGDCLELMKTIPDCSIDLIIADLPYAVTKNSWDCELDTTKMWAAFERIISDNGAIILFGQDKFSAKIMMSNTKLHRYNLIWEKTTPTGHLNAKRMPMRSHEDMMIFYKKLPVYNPQMTTGHTRKVSLASHRKDAKFTSNYGEQSAVSYDSTERYPKSIWTFATDRQKSALHPTQKPVLLIEELIKTYSNESMTILDPVAGSGTTAIAARNLNRNFIVIEKDEKYYNDILERLSNI